MSPAVNRLLERLRDVAQLMRVELYRSFSVLVLGFFLGGGRDLAYLAAALFILAPCIYGGLYALNDVHDYPADRLHPTKRLRPVAAGRLSPRAATWVGVSLISFGLTAALVFDLKLFALALLFVALNLLYTFHLKTVPFVELVLNTLTHPLRLVAGLWLAGSLAHGPVVAGCFFTALALFSLKRIKERRTVGAAVRPVWRRYTDDQLKGVVAGCLAGLVALWPATTGWDQLLTGGWLAAAVAAVLIYLGLPRARRLAAQLRQ